MAPAGEGFDAVDSVRDSAKRRHANLASDAVATVTAPDTMPVHGLNTAAKGRRAAVSVPISLFLVWQVVLNWDLISSRLTESGDYAADSLRSRDVLKQTDGVFPRWGFHHPGPLLFWMKSAGEAIFGWLLPPFGSQLIFALLLVAGSLACFGWALMRANDAILAPTVVVLTAAWSAPHVMAVVWAPTMPIWFWLLGVGGLMAVAEERWWGSLLVVLSALALVHLHALAIPLGLVMFVSGAALRLSILRRRGFRLSRPEAKAAIAIAATLLAPLVFALVDGSSPLHSYLRGTPKDARKSLSLPARLEFVERSITTAPSHWAVLAPGTMAVVLTVMALSSATILFVRNESITMWIPLYATLVLLVYLFGISNMDAAANASIGALVPLFLVSSLFTILVKELPERAASPASIALTAVGLGVLVSTPSFRFWNASTPPSGVAEVVLSELHGPSSVVIDYSIDPWVSYANAASFALLADRKGVPWCLAQDRWPYWTTPDMICTAERSPNAVEVIFTGPTDFHISRLAHTSTQGP